MRELKQLGQIWGLLAMVALTERRTGCEVWEELGASAKGQGTRPASLCIHSNRTAREDRATLEHFSNLEKRLDLPLILN